jgi:hypothetical protein
MSYANAANWWRSASNRIAVRHHFRRTDRQGRADVLNVVPRASGAGDSVAGGLAHSTGSTVFNLPAEFCEVVPAVGDAIQPFATNVVDGEPTDDFWSVTSVEVLSYATRYRCTCTLGQRGHR